MLAVSPTCMLRSNFFEKERSGKRKTREKNRQIGEGDADILAKWMKFVICFSNTEHPRDLPK